MASESVQFDTRGWIEAFDRMGRAGQVANARALNRTITSIRAALVPDVAADIGVKQSTAREQFRIDSARPDHLVARLTVSGKRIPLIDLQARGPEPSKGKGRGVTAMSRGGRKRYPNAFIATMRAGHKGVFQRTRTSRLPIRELFGPSLPHVFAKYLPKGLAMAEEVLVKNLEHELEFALSR